MSVPHGGNVWAKPEGSEGWAPRGPGDQGSRPRELQVQRRWGWTSFEELVGEQSPGRRGASVVGRAEAQAPVCRGTSYSSPLRDSARVRPDTSVFAECWKIHFPAIQCSTHSTSDTTCVGFHIKKFSSSLKRTTGHPTIESDSDPTHSSWRPLGLRARSHKIAPNSDPNLKQCVPW